MNGLRLIPGDKLRNGDRGGTGRLQRWQMKRLANMARRVAASIFVLVEIRSARGKVEQRDSGQQGQPAASVYFGENAVHEAQSTPESTLDRANLEARRHGPVASPQHPS